MVIAQRYYDTKYINIPTTETFEKRNPMPAALAGGLKLESYRDKMISRLILKGM